MTPFFYLFKGINFGLFSPIMMRRIVSMKVKIDDTLCTGCSLCAAETPEVFAMGDDGLAKVTVVSPTGDLAAKAKDSAQNCPASAILIEE
jgi:ferredoxin